MIAGLLDTLRSLNGIIREETDLLRKVGHVPLSDELALAKQRLAAALEAQTTTLDRERPGWLQALIEDDQIALTAAVAELRLLSRENAGVLARQIELSRDLLDAIAVEAKRLAGSRTRTYGAWGNLFEADQSTPISINTSL